MTTENTAALKTETQLESIFREARENRAFPGGVAWLSRGENLLAHYAFGATTYDDTPREYSHRVTTDMLYDVASISKLFTASAALLAMRENAIDYDERAAHFLPHFGCEDKRDITIRQLLNHSSGIGFAVQDLAETPAEKWLSCIADAPLHAAIGERVIYSCTNYFLLARLVELWCGATFNDFIETRFLQPLKMTRSRFFPLKSCHESKIAPTEINVVSGAAWRGIVHDEAARKWEADTGTACGNSGLFSTASDLSRFCEMWINGGAFAAQQIMDERDIRAALNKTVRAQNYDQGLGWHLNVLSWMGPNAPQGSAGHAGFSGPTLLLCPSTREVVIVLNNRVFPTRSGPNRFRFHRQIANCLFDAASTNVR